MGKRTPSLWDRINSELLSTLGERRYSVWNRSACLVSADREEIRICFRNTYHHEKMESLCLKPFERIARRITNRNTRIIFETDGACFPLPEHHHHGRERPRVFSTFQAGPANRRALQAARDLVGGARHPPLLIISGTGLGKTHLLRAIQTAVRREKVQFYTAGQFVAERERAVRAGVLEPFRSVCRSNAVLLVDDLHLIVRHPAAARELSRLARHMVQRHRRIAFASRVHPRTFRHLPDSVRSAFLMAEDHHIGSPDTATGLALLQSRAPVICPGDSLRLIAEHVSHNHRDQLECLRRLLQIPDPTPGAARSVIDTFLNEWSTHLSMEDIARAAAERYQIPLKELYSDSRARTAAAARQACFYLSRRLLGHSYASIGHHFGRRGHTTVVEACRMLQKKPRAEVQSLLKRFEEVQV